MAARLLEARGVALICALGSFIPSANAQGLGKFSKWSAPVNLGPTVNSSSDDYHPAISRDGLSLYFTSTRPGGFATAPDFEDIWVSQRVSVDDAWGTPQHLGPNINSAGSKGVCCPNLSPDQHDLYFSGFRAGALTTYDIWVSHRENKHDDFGWEPPVNLGPGVNSDPVGQCAPTYFEDEGTGLTSLYFCRTTGPLGVPAPDFDIFVSMLRPDGVWGRAALVYELNSPKRNTRTAIRRDGLEMFITSNRAGGAGKNDLWVSMRVTTLDAWSAPVNVTELNTPAAEGGPALSWDGTTLYFFSDRSGGFGGRDLYVATRTRPLDSADDGAEKGERK